MSSAPGQQVLTELKSRLFQLYILFGSPSQEWDLESQATTDALAEHVQFLRKLEADGVMFMGGPFRAPDYDWDGSGMIVVRAQSLARAQQLAEEDPLYIRGLRHYEIRGWQLNEGRLTFTVDLDSNESGSPDPVTCGAHLTMRPGA